MCGESGSAMKTLYHQLIYIMSQSRLRTKESLCHNQRYDIKKESILIECKTIMKQCANLEGKRQKVKNLKKQKAKPTPSDCPSGV
jgi:hypothetical protein